MDPYVRDTRVSETDGPARQDQEDADVHRIPGPPVQPGDDERRRRRPWCERATTGDVKLPNACEEKREPGGEGHDAPRVRKRRCAGFQERERDKKRHDARQDEERDNGSCEETVHGRRLAATASSLLPVVRQP
jgi:hypothetical protein